MWNWQGELYPDWQVNGSDLDPGSLRGRGKGGILPRAQTFTYGAHEKEKKEKLMVSDHKYGIFTLIL